MVGATGLSMAETLTVAAMHNAVELSAMKSFDVAPEEQQQEGATPLTAPRQHRVASALLHI